MPNEFAIDGQSILVTGGTGSFGQRFVRIVLERYQPERLIVLSRDEWKQGEMAELFPRSAYPALRFALGDMRNRDRVETLLRGVNLVVHAAALKQVPAGESNPFEFVQTNTIGAQNLAHAAIRAGVSRVVALSTDKAVNPVSLYGASKLAADKILLAANRLGVGRGTRFGIVRYGNVLASRGSVVPRFLKLIEDGAEYLPITDQAMTRFWITLRNSVDVVLLFAARMNGGEIFVPRIGSMRVTDVARALAPELPHKIVGLRPGEKLHEVLLAEEEARCAVEDEEGFTILSDPQSAAPAVGSRYTSDNQSNMLDPGCFLQMLSEDGLRVPAHA